jgi:hypothetical protein
MPALAHSLSRETRHKYGYRSEHLPNPMIAGNTGYPITCTMPGRMTLVGKDTPAPAQVPYLPSCCVRPFVRHTPESRAYFFLAAR